MNDDYVEYDVVGCARCPFEDKPRLCAEQPCPTESTLAQAVMLAQSSSTTNTEHPPSDPSLEERLPSECVVVPADAGQKFDGGKAAVFQGALAYFPNAMRALAILSQRGAEKYEWGGWRAVPDGFNRYKNGAGRHNLDMGAGAVYDDAPGGTGVLHQTAVAWNELAALELLILEMLEEGAEIQVPVPERSTTETLG